MMMMSPHQFITMSNSPPPPGYTLTWSNLSYTIRNSSSKNGEKRILNNLNGLARPGTLTAVIGASGAGKSSFLDVLAQRVHQKSVSGIVTINGRLDVPMKHVSRYCSQEEALYGNLTVYETLLYAADFNLPSSTPLKIKRETVRHLIDQFGLSDVKDTIIGTPLFRGCSGGQVRRVSVASQLIGLKSGILFLDEPTSGLDSVAAGAIIRSLKSLAHYENSTIIVTIHQPSTETFELFSHLLILAQGSTIYFGSRKKAISYFESIGFPIPVHSNPCDIYLELSNTDFVEKDLVRESKNRVNTLIQSYGRSSQFNSVLGAIENVKRTIVPTPKGQGSYTNNFIHQTFTLLSRSFLNAFKNPLSYWIRVAMYVTLGALMGSTYLRMGLFQTQVQDRLSALFFAVAFLSFMAVAGIPAFLEERHVFMRENSNGLYGVGSYLASNFIVSIPFIFIITLSFSGVAYFAMGLQEEVEKFSVFVTFLFLSLLIAEAQTVFISVSIPIFVGALAITAFTNGLWMIVQGFFVQKKNIPAFWRNSFHRIDFQKYAYEILITNELTNLTFNCEKRGSNSSGCDCIIPKSPKFESLRNSSECSFRGEDVLEFYDYSDISYKDWALIMLGILVFFKIATYIALKISTILVKK